MKQIADVRLDDLEDLTMESAKQLRAYFKYEGNDSRYFQKARLASGMISAYARLRASETNRLAVELMAEKQQQPKAIGAGNASQKR